MKTAKTMGYLSAKILKVLNYETSSSGLNPSIHAQPFTCIFEKHFGTFSSISELYNT